MSLDPQLALALKCLEFRLLTLITNFFGDIVQTDSSSNASMREKCSFPSLALSLITCFANEEEYIESTI